MLPLPVDEGTCDRTHGHTTRDVPATHPETGPGCLPAQHLARLQPPIAPAGGLIQAALALIIDDRGDGDSGIDRGGILPLRALTVCAGVIDRPRRK